MTKVLLAAIALGLFLNAAKVVRAYLLKRNQLERAFSTRKTSPREISFEEAQAISEVRGEELEKERSGKGLNDETGGGGGDAP